MRATVELDKEEDNKKWKWRTIRQVTCFPFNRITIIVSGSVMKLGPKESKLTRDWKDWLSSRTNSLPGNSTVTLPTQLCYFSKGSQKDR